ncbi:MAG: hypothetical protein JJ863_04325 [Deltaproteobacteria bacterium]|nr:hypothetical protein [Deltaproteobacteria bacterium]
MSLHRPTLRTFLCASLLAAACGDDAPGDDAGLPDGAATPWVEGCPPTASEGLPVLSLRDGGPWETFLLAGRALPESVALDHSVFPPAPVDFVEIAADHDPAFVSESWRLEADCPRRLDLAPWADSERDEVVSATVVAGHTDDPRLRTARIFVPHGSRTLRVTLEAGVDGDAWALFEPAAGSARLWVQRVTADADGVFELSDVPDLPGTLAIVDSPELALDDTGALAVAPPGFASSFRTRVERLHALASPTWTSETLQLPLIVGAAEPVLARGPSGPPIELDSITPSTWMLGGSDRTDEVEVRVSCAMTSLRVAVPAFATAVLATGAAETSIEPGGQGDIPITCEEGDEWMSAVLRVRSHTGRRAAVLLDASIGDET